MTTNYEYFRKKYSTLWGPNTLEKLLKKQKFLQNKTYIRINSSKISQEEVLEFFRKNRIKYQLTSLPNCIEITKTFFNISSSPLSLLGEIYIQDYASQIPIHCIDWNYISKNTSKPITILDMASSPGSKISQLADILHSLSIPYQFTLLDSQKRRLTKLYNNIQKQEIDNVEIFNKKAEEFVSSHHYDIVLVDAPCSGNLIDEKQWIKKRDQKGINDKAKLQRKILSNAYSLTKSKGIILYSTCSLEIEENEENTNWFLKNYNVDSIRPAIKLPFKTTPILFHNNTYFEKDVSKTLRVMPLVSNTQAFYIGIFKKR